MELGRKQTDSTVSGPASLQGSDPGHYGGTQGCMSEKVKIPIPDGPAQEGLSSATGTSVLKISSKRSPCVLSAQETIKI